MNPSFERKALDSGQHTAGPGLALRSPCEPGTCVLTPLSGFDLDSPGWVFGLNYKLFQTPLSLNPITCCAFLGKQIQKGLLAGTLTAGPSPPALLNASAFSRCRARASSATLPALPGASRPQAEGCSFTTFCRHSCCQTSLLEWPEASQTQVCSPELGPSSPLSLPFPGSLIPVITPVSPRSFPKPISVAWTAQSVCPSHGALGVPWSPVYLEDDMSLPGQWSPSPGLGTRRPTWHLLKERIYFHVSSHISPPLVSGRSCKHVQSHLPDPAVAVPCLPRWTVFSWTARHPAHTLLNLLI